MNKRWIGVGQVWIMGLVLVICGSLMLVNRDGNCTVTGIRVNEYPSTILGPRFDVYLTAVFNKDTKIKKELMAFTSISELDKNKTIDYYTDDPIHLCEVVGKIKGDIIYIYGMDTYERSPNDGIGEWMISIGIVVPLWITVAMYQLEKKENQ